VAHVVELGFIQDGANDHGLVELGEASQVQPACKKGPLVTTWKQRARAAHQNLQWKETGLNVGPVKRRGGQYEEEMGKKGKCGKKMLRRNDTLKKENVNGSGLVGSTRQTRPPQ
jgi:hypothetical protein